MALARALGIVSRDILPHDKGRYLLNGKRLFDMGLTLGADGVEVGELSPATDFLGVSGRSGFVDNTLTDELDTGFIQSRTLTIHLITSGLESDANNSKMSISRLAGSSIRFRDLMLPGEWRGRVTSVEWTDVRNLIGCYVHSEGTMEVEAQPFLIGSTLRIPAFTTSTTIRIAGNKPVYPRLHITVNQTLETPITVKCSNGLQSDPDTTRVLSCVAQDGNWVQGQTLDIDMDTMGSTVGTMPYYGVSLDSDFWRLYPGMQTIEATTGVTVTVEYEPEWSI